MAVNLRRKTVLISTGQEDDLTVPTTVVLKLTCLLMSCVTDFIALCSCFGSSRCRLMLWHPGLGKGGGLGQRYLVLGRAYEALLCNVIWGKECQKSTL